MVDRIELNARVCAGKPVIRGTRIPVAVILDRLADRQSWDQIIADFPELSAEDIAAAIHYARADIEHTDVIPLVS